MHLLIDLFQLTSYISVLSHLLTVIISYTLQTVYLTSPPEVPTRIDLFIPALVVKVQIMPSFNQHQIERTSSCLVLSHNQHRQQIEKIIIDLQPKYFTSHTYFIHRNENINKFTDK